MLEKKEQKKSDGFINKLLAKIKEERLEPKPRWWFLLKNYTLYAFGFLSLLVGAGAVSVMIYLFKFNDWEIFNQTKQTFWEFLLLTLPYFWFLFLALFVFVVYYNVKHTSRGYRYPGIILITTSIGLSILLGFVFFSWGLGKKIDDVLGRRALFYSHVFNRQIDFWSQPSEGRLAGMVIGLSEEGKYILLDRELKEWLLVLKDPIIGLVAKQPVRLLGQQVTESEFIVERILKANGPGQEFFKGLEGRPRNKRMKVFLFEGIPPSPDMPRPPFLPHY